MANCVQGARSAAARVAAAVRTPASSRISESPTLFHNSPPATTAEAAPPKPLSRATICGIPVIGYRIAMTAPIAAPISPATTTSPSGQAPLEAIVSRTGFSKQAATRAIAMPAAPRKFPRTAVRGPLMSLNATMKSIEATR